ncbi:Sec-independent protein translocase protein TatB [Pseudaestuariivita atlantica]|uniref:Preprotein translocase subunit TatB n=1 Tax=Pseudaestuariivita atlantica TaxID=1317121 RepID=A0A0L1JL08_9RHOB|nr:Sec-independent protein translocase protein TatB [Pseudaestuariivita atlantica]KNG92424.1 preprotein translocase subunit TatB [Pseudaestuariivita atlantica]
MLDLGWAEILLIGIFALIVIGPKELPGVFRAVGRFVGKARGMAREFSRAMNEAADEAGVKDISKGLNAAANPLKTAAQGVKDTTTKFMDLDPESETGKLAEKRAADGAKIKAASARAAADRKLKEAEAAREAAEKAEAELAEVQGKKDDG